ncbi:unnamed protein product [Rotaria sordida]|uniref:N-acetyltransferase domain-containing protein n=1 Tax=Rotaria sordida TaxID=392033 RepID=A0A813W3G1_9BILA|nr:unnamed protein product [Rotaria sordida]
MSLICRLMREDEFTLDFELFLMETFFQHEPMNKYLNTKIPDEVNLSWLKEVLHKAKYDNLTLAFYDTNTQHSLPVAFAINHHDKIDDHNHSDSLYSSLNKTNLLKYEHINELLTKLHENINLFEKFHCKNLFHIYLLGVDPKYRQNKLASQLIESAICIAKEKNFDMIYADATTVINTIQEHKIKTPDIGGASTPPQFVECVLNEIVKMTPTIGFSYEMQKPNLDLRYKTVD